MGRQQLGPQEVPMWEARQQEALSGKLAELRIYLFLRGKTMFTAGLLCAGCFTDMIAFNLHNRHVGGC